MSKNNVLQFVFLSALVSGCVTTIDGYKPPKPKSVDVRAQSYFDLGAAYIGKGRYDLAEPKLLRSIEVKPTSDAYNALAVLYEEKHENSMAEDTYQTLIRDFPDYSRGYLNYHIFLCKYDRQSQIAALNSTMTARGGALAGLGEVAAGDCDFSKGRLESAKLHYNRALQYDANSEGALLQLAKMEFERGFVVEAKRKVDLVNNKVGYSAESVYLSILISRELGDLQAEKKFTKALRAQFSKSPEAAEILR